VTGIPAGRVPPLQRVLLILSITSTMTIFPERSITIQENTIMNDPEDTKFQLLVILR
jgi:hypothetical protein